jgi:predicted lipoprotein with Yx(FWY)xxD motif
MTGLTAIRRPSSIALLLAVMVALVLVACTTEDEVEATAVPTAEPTASPTATDVPPAPTNVPPAPTPTPTPTKVVVTEDEDYGAEISTRSNADLGDILTDSLGMTLYIFDRDAEGVSNCSGGCLDNWPPLIVTEVSVAGDDITASIGTIDLADGSKQVTVNGFPAYYWVGDSAEGDTAGNGVGNVWWVFNPDGTPQRPAKVGLAENDDLGSILVDGAGMSLYIFDRDSEGVSNCSGGCLDNWPPLLSEYGTAALGDVTATLATIARDDGSMQVTVNGFPAYYWVGDSAEGDTAGNGVGNVWWVFNPDGTPQRPAKVGLAENDALGSILVDGAGLSLYIFDRDSEGVSNCSGGCLDNWPPLLSEYGTAALGDVTATLGTIARDDGSKQVTVNGFPAYYWVGDSVEGDTAGNGVGNVWWVFNPDGTPQRPAKVDLSENEVYGSILVDGAGMSLYLFDNDAAGVSNCSGGCLASWPPLLTEYGTAALGDVTATLGTITRDDGSVQVTVNEMPVYYWVNDASAGDAGGQALGGVWWVLDADGNAIRN